MLPPPGARTVGHVPLRGGPHRANAQWGERRWGPGLVSSLDSLPKLTRRRLLATGGASAAAATIALNPRLAAAATAVLSDPAHLRRASYAGHLGETFVIDWWGSTQRLALAEVNDLSAPDLAGRDDAFSLTFAADPGLVVGNQALRLRNDRLGSFELFVTRVDPTREGHFEAIVNRSVGVARPKAPRPSSGGQQPAAPPKRPPWRFVRRCRMRRTPKGVRLVVTLKEGSRARRAHGWLMRNDGIVGAFAYVPVRDHRAVVRLVTDRRLPRGRYELIIGTGDRQGNLDTVPVRLR